MIIGYARTSTVDQVAGLEAQLAELRAAGVERMYEEQVSSVAKREQLTAALDYAREGDVLVVTKLDRLARSTAHLLDIVEVMERKGVTLRILGLGVDTATPTGRMLLTMLGAIGQFEREVMLERQREGIAKAKADGKYRGRVPTALRKADTVRRLREEGRSPAEIVEETGVSRSSVYRILGAG